MHFWPFRPLPRFPGAKNETVPERGEIHLPFSLFAILTNSEYFVQHAFLVVPPATAFFGTQNETVPVKGKIHLP